jgi:hypothetical protein
MCILDPLLILIAGYSLTFMDEFVYSLLTAERVCDIILPRLPKRQVLEESGDIGPRKSRLLDALEGRSERGRSRSTTGSKSRSRSTSPHRSHSRSSRTSSSTGSRYISRSPSKSRSGSRSGSVLSDGMHIDISRWPPHPVCTTFLFGHRTPAFSTRPTASQGISTVLQQMGDSPMMQEY